MLNFLILVHKTLTSARHSRLSVVYFCSYFRSCLSLSSHSPPSVARSLFLLSICCPFNGYFCDVVSFFLRSSPSSLFYFQVNALLLGLLIQFLFGDFLWPEYFAAKGILEGIQSNEVCLNQYLAIKQYSFLTSIAYLQLGLETGWSAFPNCR